MMGVTDTRRQGVNQLDLYCSCVVPLSHIRMCPAVILLRLGMHVHRAQSLVELVRRYPCQRDRF
jgi:hypothetical protein